MLPAPPTPSEGSVYPAPEVLRTTKALEAFAPEWAHFWQRDPNRTPFQHPAWLLPWWHHFSQPEPRCVVLRDRRGLRAFLPFYIYVEHVMNGTQDTDMNGTQDTDLTGDDLEGASDPVSRVPQPHCSRRKLLLLGAGTSDYLDGLFAPDCTVEEVTAALQSLLRDGGFDTLDTMQLRAESLLTRALQQLGAGKSEAEPTSVMPAVALADLPTKIRRNAMYYRNRAEREATLELSFATAANCREQFDMLVRLHGARWQERGESGVLDDPTVLAWHREALPLLADAGLLRLASLTRDREPLGLMYALADDPSKPYRTLYLYLPAFSLEHRDFRPGTVLLALLIDAAAREGFTTIDMLRGGESYKQLWHVEHRGTFALTYCPT